ncbi:CBR-ERS-1 protein [Loa loa]|uniref:glutamine--tRNA ligase n=1 Tax=Loa loa TaxID=7209 RepID=A0A1S0UE17_LOALO|nr:CBR-ERS-1 protein [Loa loa]EJD73912.1 CBR-ERS-1 protein [Loa loa]
MVEELKWLNLSDDKVIETQKNGPLTEKLSKIVALAKDELKIAGQDDVATKQQGTLLYHVGTRLKSQCQQHTPLVVRHVMNGNIRTEPQLVAAIEYLLSNAVKGIDEKEFLDASGVGIVITADQIQNQVKESVEKFKPEILKQRYSFNIGKILGDVKSKLKWADGSAVKREVDLCIMLLLGPKTVDDLYPKKEKASKNKSEQNALSVSDPIMSKNAEANNAQKEEETVDTIEELMRKKTIFHKVGENYKTGGYVITPNTMELLKKHIEAVKGKVVTRFPPEPNGILHIGHAKAININFGYAKAHDGICYLRFDDTNPEKEEEKFTKSIIEMVEWLGYKPYKITYSSDYFDQLYEWAVVLIKKGVAYVCHQAVDEMRGFEVTISPWRNRPVEESLQLFEDMRRGKFNEGEATLRLKIILEEGKVDPVAYRIKYCPHHRTGNKWCVYPTYDFTHCLCDSLENITHSLCTKEFQSRRSSYYWLCNNLDIYCPVQWEYGRLNMNYSVVSKRKIKALIDNKIVSDWDDPRLFTLTALRRRGIPPEAINNFIMGLGLTTAQTFIDPQLLDATARDYLNKSAPRTMAVLDPLKVTIENYDELSLPCSLSVPDFPNDPDRSKQQHTIAVDRVIFIDRSDYREGETDKDFLRLAKNKLVGLKYLGVIISLTSELKNDRGEVIELMVKAVKITAENRPKAYLHWVANPTYCQVRIYERLFRHKNPEDGNEVPGGFISDCNENSLQILEPVYIDKSISNWKVYDRYQFERVGFFSVDPDSTPYTV